MLTFNIFKKTWTRCGPGALLIQIPILNVKKMRFSVTVMVIDPVMPHVIEDQLLVMESAQEDASVNLTML